MRYMGGKLRHSKAIAELIESYRKPGQAYFEPFCGGAWVLGKVSGERFASDTNEALITYYKAIQDGYVPPDSISEQEYKDIKSKQDVKDPVTAFALICCSWGAKWAGGYARDSIGRNYAAQAKETCLKHRNSIDGVLFYNRSYTYFKPFNEIIYADPPYENTTKYSGDHFNHAEFWNTMREWSKTNTVLISEYKAPDDFVCIKEFDHYQSLRSKYGSLKTKEKVFIHESLAR